MKLEFRPTDQKNFYDVLLVDFESCEVVILVAGGRECVKRFKPQRGKFTQIRQK